MLVESGTLPTRWCALVAAASLSVALVPSSIHGQSPMRNVSPAIAVSGAVPNGFDGFGDVAMPLVGGAAGARMQIAGLQWRPSIRLSGSTPRDSDPTLRAPCVDASGAQRPCAFERPYARWYVRPGVDLMFLERPTSRWSGTVGAGWTFLPGGALPPQPGNANENLPRGRAYARGGIGYGFRKLAAAPRVEIALSQFAGRAGAVRRLIEIELWLK